MSTATAESVEAARPSPVRRLLDAIGVQNVSLLVAIALLVAIIGALNPRFFRGANLLNIGAAVSIVGLLAVVQTVVIIASALDIAVGSTAGLASVTSAFIILRTASPALGIGGALAVGLLAGLINGLIIVWGRLNPVIATLATLAAFRGLAFIISNGRAIGVQSPLFAFLGSGRPLGIPTPIFLFAAVALLVHVLMRYTDIGRNIYAIGGNPIAARLSGINIRRYVIGIYMLSGTVAAAAGILLTARTLSGQPASGSEGTELEAITAAVLGGAALNGGKGTIAGTVLAVLLLGVLTNGLTILRVPTFYQLVARGALLVVAVVIQQRRLGESSSGLPL